MNTLSRKQRRLRWLIINLIAGATLTLAVGLATPGCGLLPNEQSQSGGDTHMSGSGDMSLSKQFTQEYGIDPATLAPDGLVILHDADRRNYDLGREPFETVEQRDRTALLRPGRDHGVI